MKKVIIFLCASFVFLTTEGQVLQNYIQELSGYAADSSIVREWKEGYCVMYTSTTGGNYYFHVIDIVSGAVWSIASQDRVSDMEIIGDTLYFCGNDLLNYPTVGVFYIPNVLTNNVIVYKFRYPTRHTIVPKRMDAIRVSNGFHVFVTGDFTFENINVPFSFMADVSRFNSPGSWYVYYYVTGGKECFEDVAATDNYVVTTGHIDYTQDVVIRVFERPNNVCFLAPNASHHHMFYNPTLCDYMYFYNGNAMKPIESHGYRSISITHTVTDKVAVAYLAELSSKFGLTIKAIDISAGIPIPQVEVNAAWIPEKYNVRDIRYDENTDSLLILQEKNSNVFSGTTSGYMVMTDYGTFSTLLDLESTWPIWVRSIDKFNALAMGKIFCGEGTWDGTNIPVLSTSASDGSSCFVRTPESFFTDSFKLQSCHVPIEGVGYQSIISYVYAPTTIISTINTLCYEQNRQSSSNQ